MFPINAFQSYILSQDQELDEFYGILRKYWAEAEGAGEPAQEDGYLGEGETEAELDDEPEENENEGAGEGEMNSDSKGNEITASQPANPDPNPKSESSESAPKEVAVVDAKSEPVEKPIDTPPASSKSTSPTSMPPPPRMSKEELRKRVGGPGDEKGELSYQLVKLRIQELELLVWFGCSCL